MEKVHVSVQRLQSHLDKIPALHQAEQKTGIPKLYIVGAGGALFIMLLFVGFGPALLTNIVGVSYPTLASLRTAQSKNHDDVTQWLSYWYVSLCLAALSLCPRTHWNLLLPPSLDRIIFSAINFVDQFLSIIGLVIPYFHGIKFGLLLWLFLPQTQGAKFVWEQTLAPLAAQLGQQFQVTDNPEKAAEIAKKAE